METIKEISQREFETKADYYWSIPPDCYGSIQFAAQSAKKFYADQGIDVTKQYEQMRASRGSQWYYAGD